MPTDRMIWQEFKPWLAEHLGVPIEKISLDSPLADNEAGTGLGCDSPDFIELDCKLTEITGSERSYKHPAREVTECRKTWTVRDLLRAHGIIPTSELPTSVQFRGPEYRPEMKYPA